MAKTRKDSIKQMRELLITRREALQKALAGDLSQLKDFQETTGDVVDFAMGSAQGEISSQLAEVESRELNMIGKALRAMDNGTYGECEGCKCKIRLARLQALPYATTCINCQRVAEKYADENGGVVDWSKIFDSNPVDGMSYELD